MQNNSERKNPEKLAVIIGDNFGRLNIPRVTKIVTGNNSDRAEFRCDWKDVGSAVRAARLDAGLTQSQLAESSGVNEANLCRIERGRQTPGLATLSRIAYACGVIIAVDCDGTQGA